MRKLEQPSHRQAALLAEEYLSHNDQEDKQILFVSVLQKMALLKDLSRDGNICQFFGASTVFKGPAKLVFELMEVSRCGQTALCLYAMCGDCTLSCTSAAW